MAPSELGSVPCILWPLNELRERKMGARCQSGTEHRKLHRVAGACGGRATHMVVIWPPVHVKPAMTQYSVAVPAAAADHPLVLRHGDVAPPRLT